MNEPTSSTRDDFLIVGIGASAGGIQALQTFFQNVPADSGLAYVVILHLSPDHDSQLAEVLQFAAHIPVSQVTEKVEVEPNQVYVVPPNQSLSMADGYILVSPIHTVEERRAPVDIFFRTLAESHRERAVCVVLSGTGANGSMGLKRVKERGGAAFVQNPREAQFNEMPRNSIATGLVDDILNVAEIPAKILAYRDSLATVKIPVEPELRPADQQQALREILTHLRVRTGHDFSNYKQATILRRIERRIHVHNLPDLPSYAALMRDNADEATALLKDLLISVTNFFRDKEAFAAVEREVVPALLQDKNASDQIRVWVAGCATGEEAYSLAMQFAERTMGVVDAPVVQIFASDVDEDALAAAREGFYTLNDAADVSPERLQRFFDKQGDGFRVRSEIRDMILFAQHNVLKDPPFSRLDLATCRNLLIYLNHSAQERVLQTLHFALNPGGYLFIGSSESLDGTSDLYAPVAKEQRIFQSRQAAARLHPIPEISPRPEPSLRRRQMRQEAETRPLNRMTFGDLHQQLLEQYAPPSLVVNEAYDIVHLSERAGRYLQVGGGEPSHNLLKLARPELRLELRTALYQASQKQINVEAKNVKMPGDDGIETLNIHVRPVVRAGDTARGFMLVVFEPVVSVEDETAIFTSDEPVARQLEAELTHSKMQLRSSVEQYEVQTDELRASNEELQALNEELRSSAEELETSAEELHSINEELTTVNQELKVKIEEVTLSNNNIQNLVNSADIATIFLDRGLRINLFTPAARGIFNLQASDFGRSLSDITHRLEDADLAEDAAFVLEKLQTVEREVHTVDGRFFLMRVLPYRTGEDRIGGVVFTLVDISERKKREDEVSRLALQLEQQARLFNTTLTSISDFAYVFDLNGRFVYANQPLLDLLGVTSREIVGKNIFDLEYPLELASRLQAQIQQVIVSREAVRDETPFTSPTGSLGFYEYIFTPVLAPDGTVTSVAGSTRDVTKRRQTEDALRKSEDRVRIAVEAAEMGFWDWNVLTGEVHWNERHFLLFGMTPRDEPVRPEDFFEHVDEADREQVGRKLQDAVEQNHLFQAEFRARLEDGTIRWMEGYGQPVEVENGRATRMSGVMSDITERKAAEEALRESEARLQRAVQVDTVGVLFFDAGGTFTGANDALLRMIGFSRQEFIARRLTFEDVTPPEWMPRTQQAMAELKATGRLPAYEKELQRPDGTRWWSLCAGTRLSANENVKFIIDISESKSAEAAVRDSEARFRTLSDAVPQVIWTNEASGKANYFNQRWFDYSGLSLDDSLGLGWQAIVHPDDAPASVERWHRALVAGETFDTEYRLRRSDGAYRWHIGRNVPLRDEAGQVLGWFGTATDIDDLKQVEEALRESEERFRLLVEGTRDYAMFLMDENRRIVHWNMGAERVFGWTRDEIIGQSGDIIFTPEDREAGAPELEAQGAIEYGQADDKRWHLRRGGDLFWVDGIMAALHDESGNLSGFAKIARDATKERAAEAALQQAHDEMEVRVRERTASLRNEVAHRRRLEDERKRLLQRLVEAQEDERRRLSRELHDQMGQTLSALMMNLKALPDASDNVLSPPSFNARIQTMQSLTTELMDSTHRLARELRPSALDNFGLEAALGQYVSEWSSGSVSADFVSHGVSERLPPAVDSAIYRVVQEALTNVSRHANASRVSVLLEHVEGEIVAIIEDNGQGFDVEALGETTPSRLGMVGMRERMELIGGTLTVESTLGEGTTVYARVPVGGE